MITKKKITVPIFEYDLYIFIFDDYEELHSLIEYKGNPHGLTAIYEDGYSKVFIKNKCKVGVIPHEALHVKDAIWEYIGYTPQINNDEVDAYLLEFLYKKIKEVYDKHVKVAE